MSLLCAEAPLWFKAGHANGAATPRSTRLREAPCFSGWHSSFPRLSAEHCLLKCIPFTQQGWGGESHSGKASRAEKIVRPAHASRRLFGGFTRPRAHPGQSLSPTPRTRRRRTKGTRWLALPRGQPRRCRQPRPARAGRAPPPPPCPPRPREMAAAPQNGSRARSRAGADRDKKGAANPCPHHSRASHSFPLIAAGAGPSPRPCSGLPAPPAGCPSSHHQRGLCAGAAFALPKPPFSRKRLRKGVKLQKN